VTTTDTTERAHLSMRGIGYDPEEARILADHVIDAALCGYEYSGLPKLLNAAEHPRKAPRSPLRVVRETGVSVLFDGGNQNGRRRALAAEIAAIKATPRQEGVGEIRVPGERAYRERARLAREGIEIDRPIQDALIRLADGTHA
jgi:LDH2 family malate/lactate/ureidoglycolate dehydrogenase